jgi:hypothetical protein
MTVRNPGANFRLASQLSFVESTQRRAFDLHITWRPILIRLLDLFMSPWYAYNSCSTLGRFEKSDPTAERPLLHDRHIAQYLLERED